MRSLAYISLFVLGIGLMSFVEDGGTKCKAAKFKGKWEGIFYQFSYGYDEKYKMEVLVDDVTSCKLKGKFVWYQSGKDVSGFTGVMRRDTIFLREGQQLSGSMDLVVNGVYVIPWKENSRLKGYWLTPSKDGAKKGGTFYIDKKQ